MRKIIGYLKPFWAIVILIFVLLFAQAMSDLSLPGYMSNIVNVGIQQNGIENAVPQAIRASEFSKVTLFMSGYEKAQMVKDYTLLDKSWLSDADYAGYVKTYPDLANEPIYILNTADKEVIKDLDSFLRKYLSIVSTIENGGATVLLTSQYRFRTGLTRLLFFLNYLIPS